MLFWPLHSDGCGHRLSTPKGEKMMAGRRIQNGWEEMEAKQTAMQLLATPLNVADSESWLPSYLVIGLEVSQSK